MNGQEFLIGGAPGRNYSQPRTEIRVRTHISTNLPIFYVRTKYTYVLVCITYVPIVYVRTKYMHMLVCIKVI